MSKTITRPIFTRSKKWYGLIPSLKDSNRPKFSLVAPETLPPSVNLVNAFQPPIYNQLELGSCVSNGTARAIQYDRAKQGEWSPVPSRLFIYYNARVLEGDPGQDAGCSVADAVAVLRTQGVCPENKWPYRIGQFAVRPPRVAYDWAAGMAALNVETVPENALSIKTVLAAGIPVIIGVTLFESFESDQVANTGIVPMPAADEAIVGGHCMVIVGFSDDTQDFLTANSWGTDWGQQGYCQMPYAYFGANGYCDEAWAIYTTK